MSRLGQYRRGVQLEIARGSIGVVEEPRGSNDGPQIRAWLREAGVGVPAPWCAAFAYACALAAGSFAVRQVPYPASVLSWVETAQARGWTVKRPLRGDDVAYSWHGRDPHPGDHMGIVERVLALPRPRRGGLSWRYWIRTVEGNTGDAVRRRWRWVDPGSVCFIRLPF